MLTNGIRWVGGEEGADSGATKSCRFRRFREGRLEGRCGCFHYFSLSHLRFIPRLIWPLGTASKTTGNDTRLNDCSPSRTFHTQYDKIFTQRVGKPHSFCFSLSLFWEIREDDTNKELSLKLEQNSSTYYCGWRVKDQTTVGIKFEAAVTSEKLLLRLPVQEETDAKP